MTAHHDDASVSAFRATASSNTNIWPIRRTPRSHSANPLFEVYDPLFEGCGLAQTQECDLRALARVFDIDAGGHVASVDIWAELKLRIMDLD
jgi:hypothetical protein